jgi:hypothetical protein
MEETNEKKCTKERKKERKKENRTKVYEIFVPPSIQSSGGWDPMLLCHLPFPLVVGRSIFNT